MHRGALTILTLGLLVAACGGGDTTGTTGTATTAASGTSGATTTVVPTTMAVTTTVADDPVAARVAAAQMLQGTYEGEWNNTTFGSTGSVFVNVVEVNADAGYALVQIDLGGNVFGAADPDLFAVEIDLLSEGPWESTTPLLGTFTIDSDSTGHFTLSAPSVPGLGLPLVVEADVTADGFEGTYGIEGLATGTFTATRT